MDKQGHIAPSAVLRRMRALLARAIYRRQKWLKEVKRCQQEISACDAHPYYTAAYRNFELWYWLHIPRWMSELSSAGFQARRVLDIGCGYGTLALFAKSAFHCEVYCTDFSDTFLSPTLLRKHAMHFAVNNIERDEFPWPLQFDVILLTEVLEHFNFSPHPTLRKIRDRLAPGGKLFLTTPDAGEWGRTTRYYPRLADIPLPGATQAVIDDHVWQYTKDELLGVLQESGFQVEKLDYSPGTPNRHFNLQASGNKT